MRHTPASRPLPRLDYRANQEFHAPEFHGFYSFFLYFHYFSFIKKQTEGEDDRSWIPRVKECVVSHICCKISSRKWLTIDAPFPIVTRKVSWWNRLEAEFADGTQPE